MSTGPYRYKSRTCKQRTAEAQANLLAEAAHRVWDEWFKSDENGERIRPEDECMDQLMRYLYSTVKEMDVFYAGRQSVEEEGGS